MSAAEYRSIVLAAKEGSNAGNARSNCQTIEGYVHKFRLEAREEATARILEPALATPTVHLGALLGKFVLLTLALAGIGAAGARAIGL